MKQWFVYVIAVLTGIATFFAYFDDTTLAIIASSIALVCALIGPFCLDFFKIKIKISNFVASLAGLFIAIIAFGQLHPIFARFPDYISYILLGVFASLGA